MKATTGDGCPQGSPELSAVECFPCLERFKGKQLLKSSRAEEKKGPLTLGWNMEGYGYEHFSADGAFESQQVDYRRIVGDSQPPCAQASPREHKHFVRQTSHGHGHETAAQRYSATRILAGLGSER